MAGIGVQYVRSVERRRMCPENALPRGVRAIKDFPPQSGVQRSFLEKTVDGDGKGRSAILEIRLKEFQTPKGSRHPH
jgi:hypothetical protein